MRIFGFMLVKDEADIIAQTLKSLLDVGSFEKIFVFDNGSTDGTLEIANRFDDCRIVVESVLDSFSDNLKYTLVYEKNTVFSDGDWFAVLDADEIFQTSLAPLIEYAEATNANVIEGRSAQFYLTEKDNCHNFDPQKPAIEQRRYYLVNYGEPRIFKYDNSVAINADMVKARGPYFRHSNKSFDIHHFQYRSVAQLQSRLANRIRNHPFSNNWGHVKSARWQDYMVPSIYLHQFDGQIRTGLPDGANLYRIKNNVAYTMSTLRWMRRQGYLTDNQLEFFNASRMKRLYRRFIVQ